MLQKLCTRAIVPVALAVTGFVVLCCLLFYTIIQADLTEHAAEQSATLAGMVLKSTRYAMLRDDRETLRNILQNVASQKGVEHARIFNKEGRVMFSGHSEEVARTLDKTAEGCAGCHSGPVPIANPELSHMTRLFIDARGVETLAVTAPVYNEPECAGTACHVDPSRRKVLGMLDIGLDQAPQRAALATLRLRMILFSLMVLVLTVGGVAALLHHQVFLPVRRLTDFTEDLSNGIFDGEFPRVCGELERLAGHLQRLVRGRNDATGPDPGCGPEPGKEPDAESSPGEIEPRCQPGAAGDPGQNP
jgi:nitrogen fixation/metabolism regulation signal transduction histidine kinase